MIISKEHEFCFVHIPKCAGTHIRRSIQKYDEAGSYTNRIDFHQVLGEVDFAHIPLNTLQQYFPIDFNNVKNSESFAVLRDPYARFYSAVSQHSKSSRRRALKDLSAKQIEDDVNSIISWLRLNGDRGIYPPDKIFFLPQHRYVYVNDIKIIKHLFTTKTIDFMMEKIAGIIGEPITKIKSDDTNAVASNKSLTYRGDFQKRIYYMFGNRYVAIYKKFLPVRVINILQNYLYKPAGSTFSELIGSPETNAFIEEFYHDDILLYKSVCGETL